MKSVSGFGSSDVARPRNARNKLPSWPVFGTDELAAVERVLRSGKVNYWTGEEGRAFETEFADAVGVSHAIAVANGTLALELALKGFGVGPGDEVVVTPRSFIASTSVAVLQGAVPVFADIDRDTQNITAESIRRVITPRTRAIIPVHLGGWPCEMAEIMQLAETHGLKVLEDCAQAAGATYRNRPVGSFGHAAAFSFCQDKIISTGGEGGMLVMNDAALWERCWSFKDHGKTVQAINKQAAGGEFRWLHESFGSNYRLTELQAAIGRLQLQKLEAWHRQRESNALQLANALRECSAVRIPLPPAHVDHAWYRLYAFVVAERLAPGWSRRKIISEIVAGGVPCFVGSCPEIYLEHAFQLGSFSMPKRLPIARELGDTAMCFLVHPTLDAQDIELMCEVILHVLNKASNSPAP